MSKDQEGKSQWEALDARDPRYSLIAEAIESWRPGARDAVASMHPLSWRNGDEHWVFLVQMRDGNRVVHRRFDDAPALATASTLADIFAREGVLAHGVLWKSAETASAIMEYIEGVLLQEALEASTPDRQAELMEKTVRLLARAQDAYEKHAARLEDLYVNALGRSLEAGDQNDFAKWLPRWSRNVTEDVLPRVFRKAGRPVDAPAFREAARLVREILLLFRDIPCNVGLGDFWTGNMILSPDARPHLIDFEHLTYERRDWDLARLLTEIHCFADCGLSPLPRRDLAMAFHEERTPEAPAEAWLAEFDAQLFWQYWVELGWTLKGSLERAERGERNAWEEARSGRPEDRLRRMVHNYLRIEPLCEDSAVARFQELMRDVVSDWPEVETQFETLTSLLAAFRRFRE